MCWTKPSFYNELTNTNDPDDDTVLTFLMLTIEYPIMMRAKKAGKTTKAAMLSLGMIASRECENEREIKM